MVTPEPHEDERATEPGAVSRAVHPSRSLAPEVDMTDEGTIGKLPAPTLETSAKPTSPQERGFNPWVLGAAAVLTGMLVVALLVL